VAGKPSCEGKRAYSNWTLAERMAMNTNRDRDGAHVQPYHCRYCSRFHVGGSDYSPRSGKRAGRVKQR